jgi:SAM-dependent methyltransferase
VGEKPREEKLPKSPADAPAGARTAEASPTAGSGRAASPWVARFLSGVAPGGLVLDVACGGGRHLRLARALGLGVTGIDRDLAGCANLGGTPGVELIAADLETGAPWPLAGRTFDAVVVTNYLWRPIFPDIVAAVARSGLLIYETFAAGNERFGSPRNPAFLLQPGELVERTRPALVPIAYEHVRLAEPDRMVARIVAAGPDHVWLKDPPRPQF